MTIIYLNGNYVDGTTPLIHHHDSGFTTGIGIFDSMLAINGESQFLIDHLDRINHDAETVVGLKPDLDDFENIVQTLINKNNLNDQYIRIRTTISGGVASIPLAKAENLTVLIDVASCAPPPDTAVKCAVISDFPRIAGCPLENCKRLDYSRSYNARLKAKNLGAEEAIMMNTDGNIACGATSNIFIEENKVLITPPLKDGVLAGVTRKNIIATRDVIEETISLERFKNADRIYLTNSFIGLREVTLI